MSDLQVSSIPLHRDVSPIGAGAVGGGRGPAADLPQQRQGLGDGGEDESAALGEEGMTLWADNPCEPIHFEVAGWATGGSTNNVQQQQVRVRISAQGGPLLPAVGTAGQGTWGRASPTNCSA